MIQCVTVELDSHRSNQLREWLARPSCHLLQDVARGLVTLHQGNALNHMLAAQERPLKLSLADEDMRRAYRFQTFLDVLDEIMKLPAFHTTKFT